MGSLKLRANSAANAAGAASQAGLASLDAGVASPASLKSQSLISLFLSLSLLLASPLLGLLLLRPART